MASQKENFEVNCEFCNKPFFQTTILRHIGQSTDCKKHYGPRFLEMKKEKGRNKVYKFRNKIHYIMNDHNM